MEVRFNLIVKDSSLYYDVLKEEDFNFNNKSISVEVMKGEKGLLSIKVLAGNLLDIKIGINAVLNSLIVMDKSLNVLENE